MLKIIKNEFFKCKICHLNYTEKNYPVFLTCEETLCLECYNNMKKEDKPCPFEDSHFHNNEEGIKNLKLISLIADINNLIKINKQDNKYDILLKKLIEDLKKKKKKAGLITESYKK